MEIQIRYKSGGIVCVTDMQYALHELLISKRAVKISFHSPTGSGRMILYFDGTWEHRTPESIKEEIGSLK